MFFHSFIFWKNQISVLILYVFAIYITAINKSFLGETGCLSNPSSLVAPGFLIYHLSLNTITYVTLDSLHLTVQLLYDLRDAIPLYWSPSASSPNHFLGKQRISLGVGKYFNNVPLRIELIYFQPKRYYFVCLCVTYRYRTLY